MKEEDEDKNLFVISLVLIFNACCIDIHRDDLEEFL